MSQLQRFNCGGFVIYKALGKRLSASYHADGNLLDSELTDSLGRQRRPGKSDLEALKRLGRVYQSTAT